MDLNKEIVSPIQFIENYKGVDIFIKREDLIHPIISGNKWRKLKYNLLAAKNQNVSTILTFGGAFSNHIVATAAACKEFGFESIGVIRGEKYEEMNPTLATAKEFEMHFYYVIRSEYKNKTTSKFINKLTDLFGEFYLIPEGGDNELGIKGCKEIVNNSDEKYDVICCACGTGSTFTGLIESSFEHQQIFGFPVLKLGESLELRTRERTTKKNWKVIKDFHCGGYAKINEELIEFINSFYDKFNIPLDPIYTGKMALGVYKLINNGEIAKGKKILLIHTGGIQGAQGIEKRYGVKLNYNG